MKVNKNNKRVPVFWELFSRKNRGYHEKRNDCKNNEVSFGTNDNNKEICKDTNCVSCDNDNIVNNESKSNHNETSP